MDIIKHKRNKACNDDTDGRGRDIRLIEKRHYAQNKQHQHHESTSQSIQSVSDIYCIDDGDRNKES
jgi:hypothetical protein